MGTDDLREKSIEETQQISPRNVVDALCGSFKHDGNTNPLGRENVKIPCKHILKEKLHLFQVALAKAGPRYALWERLRLHLTLMPSPPWLARTVSVHRAAVVAFRHTSLRYFLNPHLDRLLSNFRTDG